MPGPVYHFGLGSTVSSQRYAARRRGSRGKESRGAPEISRGPTREAPETPRAVQMPARATAELGGPRHALIPRERLPASPLRQQTPRSRCSWRRPIRKDYGSTQWDAADERPFVWVTLAEGDVDPAHLLGSIVRAVGEMGPMDEGVLAALSVPRPRILTSSFQDSSQLLGVRAPLRIGVEDLQAMDGAPSLTALSAARGATPAPRCSLRSPRAASRRSGLGGSAAHRRLVDSTLTTW